MNLNTITDLLKKAIKSTKPKYTLLHDDTKPTKLKGKGYKIVCESKPLPFTKEQILSLEDDQAKLLEAILLHRKTEKKITAYEKLMITNNNSK